MEFHGFLGSLENSDRSAHDRDAMERSDFYLLSPRLEHNANIVAEQRFFLVLGEQSLFFVDTKIPALSRVEGRQRP